MSASATAAAQQAPEIARAELGFAGRYKVGCWTPLRLELEGGEDSLNVVAEVRVPDGDGLVTSLFSSPVRVTTDQRTTVEMLVRIGQLDAPLEVRLLDVERGRQVARRTFSTFRDLDDGGILPGDPATTRMVVEVGNLPLGTTTVDAEQSSEQWYVQDVVARRVDLGKLPQDYLGYEAVNTVVLSTSDRDAWSAVRGDDARITALEGWVARGGRLVMLCGSQSDLVIGADGPLARLAPGTLRDMVTVDNLGPLEDYVGGNEPLPRRGRFQLSVPRLERMAGEVELALGGRENQLPLVVRARHGLGQVVFVGFDLDTGLLGDWEGRSRLMEKLLNFSNDQISPDTEDYYYMGPSDVTAALSEQLDRALEDSGIRTPPFLAIAGLVVLYILVIGPGDYFLVKRVLKRMEWTWITFPLIVVLSCAAAYWYADHLKGDDLRVNQVEILDIDTTTGLARGTMWTHVFSPRPDRYDLTLAARTPAGEEANVRDAAVAWLGRPGEGLGGMNVDAGSMPGGPAYRWSADRSEIRGLPIEVWSTKTLVTRWTTDVNETEPSDLTQSGNNMVTGTVTNPVPVELNRCKLIYGNWAWRLGDLAPGQTVTIERPGIGNTGFSPRNLRTVYSDQVNVDITQGSYYEKQMLVEQIPLEGLAEMMMFHDQLGGRSKLYLWHRYQEFTDLSRSLDRDTAMLIGSCSAPRSELVRTDADGRAESMRHEADKYVVHYRFVLPVAPFDAGEEGS